jgi:PadR family transcriptional regulator, regulatory protein PadR
MEINKWISQARKGTLELGILVLLKNKERYGLEIIQLLEKCGGLEITEGTIYPLLNRLKKEGMIDSEWVESESGHPRKYYFLTKDGQKQITEMTDYWRKFSKTLSKLIDESERI